ncbi:Efflux pump FUS6 [Apiospora hydei]|uniref:Efflux pump FUS6 n=1 Tax=Apiospora hydei TaxID=1337664 RepID=A0ABR1WBG8_9PEZI
MAVEEVSLNLEGVSSSPNSSPNVENVAGDERPRPRLHLVTYLAVVSVNLGFVAQNFAITGAGTQAQIIGQTFHSSDTGWTTGVIVIFCVVLGPIVSQCADLWGRKWFLVVLNAFGFVGSIVVARASDMPMAIAGFCVIGLSFGNQGLIHAVSGEVLPRRWRSWGQAAALVSTEIGLVLGLVVAGSLNRTGGADGFRNFYYTTAAFYFAATGLCILVYNPPPTRQQVEVVGSKLAKLDWLGFLLLAASVVLFSIALSWSQNPYSWDDLTGHVAAPFALSIALVAVLVVYERRKPDGLFHHGLFQNRMFPICLVCVFAEGISFYAANVYVPLQGSVLFPDEDFLYAPLRLAVGFVAAVMASVGTGLYCFLTKRVRWVTFVALVIFVAFFAGMAGALRGIDGSDLSRALWGLPVILGVAFGMVLVTLVTAAQLCVPASLVTISSCLMLSIRSLGGTVGFAVYQAVYQSAMSHLDENIAQAGIAEGLPQESVPDFVSYAKERDKSDLPSIPGMNESIVEAGAVALRSTYKSAFYNVWVTGAAFVSAVAVLLVSVSIFMYDPTSEFTNHIDYPIEKEVDPAS